MMRPLNEIQLHSYKPLREVIIENIRDAILKVNCKLNLNNYNQETHSIA